MERASHLDPWSEKAFIEELSLPQSNTLVVVAESCTRNASSGKRHPFPLADQDLIQEEEIFGYLCFWHVADEVQILNITVAHSQRGKGIGRRLMDYALRRANELGARMVMLEVRKSNTTARELYTKAGFRMVGERPDYYGAVKEPALIMRKDLGEKIVP